MFNRRQFLTTLGALPFLPSLVSSASFLRQSRKSLILIWMDGGMSHIDTFDGKPEASGEIRGDLPSKESSLEGVFVSEHLPKLSARMNRMTLVRSLTSPEGNHDRGSYYMLTGRRPNPVITHPSFGSMLSSPENLEGMPEYIAIPDAHPYARQGFLPLTRGPFELGGSPGVQGFKVRNLEPHPQMERAFQLLQTVDHLDGPPRSAEETARDRFLEQARHLSLNPEVRERFEVTREPEEIRRAYGNHFLGQSCLLARRLIQGGVRTVLVRFTGWDHHTGISSALTYGFPPKLVAMDQAVSALHEDLERKGLLESTLVLVASEFGRTPRMNPRGGRDHWSRASSALLFGAGTRPGTVYGRTDSRGEEPSENPVSPADLFYTILSALGADVEQTLYTPDQRPIRVVAENARLIQEILMT